MLFDRQPWRMILGHLVAVSLAVAAGCQSTMPWQAATPTTPKPPDIPSTPAAQSAAIPPGQTSGTPNPTTLVAAPVLQRPAPVPMPILTPMPATLDPPRIELVQASVKAPAPASVAAVAAAPVPAPVLPNASPPSTSSATPMLDELIRQTEKDRLATLQEIKSASRDPIMPEPKTERVEPPSPAPTGQPRVVKVSLPPKPDPVPAPIKPEVAGLKLEPTPETRIKTDPEIQRAGSESEPPDAEAKSDTAEAAPLETGETSEEERALAITETRFCRRVHGFGSVDPLPPGETLKAGQKVWLYAELTGVRYDPDEDGFRSRIASRLELFHTPEEGPVRAADSVWVETTPDVEDLCRHRRRDYFVNYVIPLPKSTKPGEYVLRLSVTDLLSNRVTTSDLPLSIAP